MASYLPEFLRPMTATALLETDLKSIIFRGMPNAWQENFVHANMRISSITLAQMTDYLASEQVIADTRRDKNPKGRGSSGQNTLVSFGGKKDVIGFVLCCHEMMCVLGPFLISALVPVKFDRKSSVPKLGFVEFLSGVFVLKTVKVVPFSFWFLVTQRRV
eukprot:scaffold129871_cov36-Attheya_sp.AAC.1